MGTRGSQHPLVSRPVLALAVLTTPGPVSNRYCMSTMTFLSPWSQPSESIPSTVAGTPGGWDHLPLTPDLGREGGRAVPESEETC